jgi:hypothetical protein
VGNAHFIPIIGEKEDVKVYNPYLKGSNREHRNGFINAENCLTLEKTAEEGH